MEVIFLLILISLAVAAGFLLAYMWAMREGQYDDTYTPAVRILFEDEVVQPFEEGPHYTSERAEGEMKSMNDDATETPSKRAPQ